MRRSPRRAPPSPSCGVARRRRGPRSWSAPFIGGAFAGQTRCRFSGILAPSQCGAVEEPRDRRGGPVADPGIFGPRARCVRRRASSRRPARSSAHSQSSNFTTVSGSLVVTMPFSITRESLRPYVVGGLGLHARRHRRSCSGSTRRPQPPGLEPRRRRDRHARTTAPGSGSTSAIPEASGTTRRRRHAQSGSGSAIGVRRSV